MATTLVDELIPRLRALTTEQERHGFLEQTLARAEASDVLQRLKDECERQMTLDPHVGLRFADDLIFAATTFSLPYYRALGLMAKGDALRVLGRYAESRLLLDEAAEGFLAVKHEVGWARTRVGWLFSCHYLGRADETWPSVERARDVLVRHQEWLRVGALCLNAGHVSGELGQYDRAFQFYDDAHAFYEQAQRADPSLREAATIRQAKVAQNKALILARQGELARALRLHEDARAVFERLGETLSTIFEDQFIADIYVAQGFYTRALRRYVDVQAALERAKLPLDAAHVALSRAECYLRLNLDDEARELADQAIEQFRSLGAPTELGKAQFFAALASARSGDVAEALDLLGHASETFASTGLTSYLGLTTLQRAALHLDREEWNEASRLGEEAAACFGERGMVVRQAQANLVQARAARALDRIDLAAVLARSALRIAEERGLRWLASEAHHLLAGVARARHDPTSALRAYRAATENIEWVQGALANELRTNFLADKLQVYHDAIDFCLDEREDAHALDFLERAKSRALVDYLAQRPEVRLHTRDQEDQALLDELARLRVEHHWLYDRAYSDGLTDQADQTLSRAVYGPGDVRTAIEDREKRIAGILEQLALHRAERLEVIQTPTANDRPTLPTLEPGTVLFEYYLRPDRAVVFVVTDGTLSVVPLAVRPADLRRLLGQWQLNLAATARAMAAGRSPAALSRNAQSILEAFYNALIRPAEPYLRRHDRLIVIPYDGSHAVPFQALHDGQRFLIQTTEVSICPSSTLLQMGTRRRLGGSSALVLAHSDGGRLPGTIDEARMVGALLNAECYVEMKATREAVIAAAPRHGIVHVAAHGEARLDKPTFSHLKLADGHLTMADIFNLDLDGALVVLSACETGQSRIAAGDEVIGLSRGFLVAGAAALVQSQWRVEDTATARLMELFYRALRAGQSAGSALRAAQLATLADRGDHPYVWAPFQLVGNAGLTPYAANVAEGEGL